ncbi:MAG TPA: DUF1385 domain-containing protein [Patescibacteria group bacterium]|nr:DUF1385 domain-containing protein [Patescibacteria group bacterium]
MSEQQDRTHLHVGGQAVIEGVMMRSPTRLATAVRTPDGGIVVKAERFVSLTKRHRLLNIPVVRGAIVLIETFVVAVRALSFSAEQAMAEEERKEKKGNSNIQMALTVMAALVIGFGLFFYLPLKLTEWIGFQSGFLFNLVDGLIRLVFIFLYIFLITRWKEMQRIFEYHGAEHKTIYAFEAEGEVSPETAMRYSRLHPRCSTSFLLIVVIVSLLLFIMLGRPEGAMDRMIRFSFIPVIAGVSYEVLKASARPSVQRYLGFVFWPGLLLQRLTTREPSPDQIEVAITALNASLEDKLLES